MLKTNFPNIHTVEAFRHQPFCKEWVTNKDEGCPWHQFADHKGRWGTYCRSRESVAVKLIRLASIEYVIQNPAFMFRDDPNLHVFMAFRDPRSVVASRWKLTDKTKWWDYLVTYEGICRPYGEGIKVKDKTFRL